MTESPNQSVEATACPPRSRHDFNIVHLFQFRSPFTGCASARRWEITRRCPGA